MATATLAPAAQIPAAPTQPDPEAVRAHVRQLHEDGGSYNRIAAAAGLDSRTVRDLISGRRPVTPYTTTVLLAVTTATLPRNRVDAGGIAVVGVDRRDLRAPAAGSTVDLVAACAARRSPAGRRSRGSRSRRRARAPGGSPTARGSARACRTGGRRRPRPARAAPAAYRAVIPVHLLASARRRCRRSAPRSGCRRSRY